MTVQVQCIPNFSEGRDSETIRAIVNAVRETERVRLADWSVDIDHNRLVVTFVGPPEPVRAAALAAGAAALSRIDLTGHQGVHPRLGALDVLPFVPLAGIDLSGCAALARAVGQELAHRHALPVFFYEAASPSGRSLPTVRKEAFQTLRPDFGPPVPHPTAGAVAVGARLPLVAYNVNLATSDIAVARTIARALRNRPDFPGLRALGLPLPSRGLVQVSMNLTRPAETPLLSVLREVTRLAEERGTAVLESELIGAMPLSSARDALAEALQMPQLQSGQVLWEQG